MPLPGWTRDQVIDALRAYHGRTGRWPTVGEWRCQRGAPSVAFIARTIGWRAALVVAGGESRRVSHCRHGHPLTDDHLVVRSDGG